MIPARPSRRRAEYVRIRRKGELGGPEGMMSGKGAMGNGFGVIHYFDYDLFGQAPCPLPALYVAWIQS